jgi:DNA-binding response OmpR family regulator/HPt (histidine-containing phosphotransfer) domain-containing protein
MRVLIVDDDREVARLVARELDGQGYAVDTVGLAQQAVDLGLPDGDGLELVRALRQRGSHTPILVVTARRRVEDRVVGLVSGADDYLVKPFALPELRARVSALLRRPARIDRTRTTVANMIVDRDALEAVVDDKSLPLTRKQFALLDLLARRKGTMTPRRTIEEALYGFDDVVSPNSIEAHVYKLRAALRAAGAEVTIETRRGIGYRLVPTAAASGGRASASSDPAAMDDGPLLDTDGSFRQRLSDDRATLAALEKKLDQRGDRVLTAIAVLAHRLAGAAGTFGHDDIGEAAAVLEQRTETVLAAGVRQRARLLGLVRDDIASLAALLDEQRHTVA